MRKTALVLCVLLILSTLSACGSKSENSANNGTSSGTLSEITTVTDVDTSQMDLEFTDNDRDDSYSEAQTTVVDNNQDVVKITADGTYKISGKHSQIVVSAPETAKPQIILENATIASTNGPAIYIEQADKVFITVPSGSTSVISDSASYDSSYDNADAAVFSRADLTINGGGSLKITGNYKSAIASKDDLVISDTVINAESIGCAIEGKDCVKLTNANITIDSDGDGIKSNNTEDENRGYVYIESGNYSITALNDGIQAETALIIENGSFNITTGGGSKVSSSNSDSGWGMWGGGFGRESSNSTSNDSESAKALKCSVLIKISGGDFTIDSSDDAVHSNSDLEMSGGTFNIASGDDGIHADDELIINNGTINISKSYEGIEATVINVSGGNIDVTASDDGFNAAGGNDSSAMGDRPGQNPFESDNDANINIAGGYICVNASGDGIDSNGNITVSGGVLLVSGPQNSGNGALDYGGTAVINGGTAVIVGASGMAQSFSSSSQQANIMYNVSSSINGGVSVSISDGKKVIASFLPAKQFNSIVISSPDLKVGSTYTLNIGGTVTNTDSNGYTANGTVSGADTIYDIELTSTSYSNSGSQGGFGGGGMGGGGHGGRPF